MEALFNPDQRTDPHQLTTKKREHTTAGERANSWNGMGQMGTSRATPGPERSIPGPVVLPHFRINKTSV